LQGYKVTEKAYRKWICVTHLGCPVTFKEHLVAI